MSSVRITAAFIADGAERHDRGGLNITNGWAEWWNLRSLPDQQVVRVVVVAEVEPSDLGHPVRYRVDVTDFDGSRHPVVDLEQPPPALGEYVAGAPAYLPKVIPITIDFRDVGVMVFTVSVNDATTEVRLAVRLEPLT